MGQKDLFYFWLSVRDNVVFGVWLCGEKVDCVWVVVLFEQVEFLFCVDVCLVIFFGGMCQCVVLVCMLYEDCFIVLMDEFFLVLDIFICMWIQILVVILLVGCMVVFIIYDLQEVCWLSYCLLVFLVVDGDIDDSYYFVGIFLCVLDVFDFLIGQVVLLQQLMRV